MCISVGYKVISTERHFQYTYSIIYALHCTPLMYHRYNTIPRGSTVCIVVATGMSSPHALVYISHTVPFDNASHKCGVACHLKT